MDLNKFLKKLAKEKGKISVKDGVISFSDGKTFDLKAALKSKGYLIIQEGGTSHELYLHAHSTAEEAEEDRVSCARAAYSTSPVIKIPGVLASLGEQFYGVVEEVLSNLGLLDMPEVPTDSEDAEDE